MAVASVMSVDVPCAGCGYNLRGLGGGAVCPECAFPVGESVRVASPKAEDLTGADVGWVRGIAVGCWLPVGAMGVLMLAGWAAAFMTGTAGRDRLMVVADVAARVMVIAAAVLLSRREPGEGVGAEGAIRRRVLRWAAVLTITPYVMLLMPAGWRADWMPLVVMVVFVLEPLVSYLFYQQVARVAERVPARWRGFWAGYARMAAIAVATVVVGTSVVRVIDRVTDVPFPVAVVGDPVSAARAVAGVAQRKMEHVPGVMMAVPAALGVGVAWWVGVLAWRSGRVGGELKRG